jgi:hypothetical protein
VLVGDPAFQAVAQSVSRAVDSRLDGAFWNFEYGGDLSIRETLDVVERDDHAEIVWQPEQGILHLNLCLFADDNGFGIAR